MGLIKNCSEALSACKSEMEKQHISVSDMEKRLYYSRDGLRPYLNGKSRIRLDTFLDMLSILGCTIYLESGEGLSGAYKCGYEKGRAYALDRLDEIIVEQLDKSNNQVECQTLRWVLDKISEIL